MEIKKEEQYNISSSKFKMLSSASGIGSIIPTKWGGFVMPLNINNWQFINTLTDSINNRANTNYTSTDHQNATGVEIVEDERFIRFLQFKKDFINLKFFAAIPHASLSGGNFISYREHPMFIEQQTYGRNLNANMFYIPAVDFPKWFISENGELKRIDEWLHIWRTETFTKNGQQLHYNDGRVEYFAPPRDPYGPTPRKYRDQLADQTIYKTLTPVTLVLICPNGHISDIDWYKYFCAKLDNQRVDDQDGFDLFGYDCNNHCNEDGNHKLKWLLNRNQAESWGTLKCSRCGRTVSLTGIMNLKAFCRGEKPWEPAPRMNWVPTHEQCLTNGNRTIMQVAMVTSNSIYYALSQSSLYIPINWTTIGGAQLQDDANEFLTFINDLYTRRLNRNANLTKDEFLNTNLNIPNATRTEALIIHAENNDYTINECEANAIISEFLGDTQEVDIVKTYRLNEYNVFVNNDRTPEHNSKIEFNDIVIPNSLSNMFLKIKQVPMLAITSTQLGFSRVKMPTPRWINGQVVLPNEQIRPIYSGNINDVRVLPANQIYGEGLFFAFDNDRINNWSAEFELETYYNVNIEPGSMGEFLASEMENYGRARFYLLHTFSHIIMKELEFSCGYPTASLSERLYYSDEMCGVLIFTADGSEGSMGGLVWQGQPELIEKIIKSALQRAVECSSDPLCWENSDGLNKASCFSCTMVSETSCEHGNLGLDRRALVDPDFGYFRDLL